MNNILDFYKLHSNLKLAKIIEDLESENYFHGRKDLVDNYEDELWDNVEELWDYVAEELWDGPEEMREVIKDDVCDEEFCFMDLDN